MSTGNLTKAVNQATVIEQAQNHTQAMKAQSPVIGKADVRITVTSRLEVGSAIVVEAQGTTEETARGMDPSEPEQPAAYQMGGHNSQDDLIGVPQYG